MESILQIERLNRSELISIIEKAIDTKLTSLKESSNPETLSVKEVAQTLKVSTQSVHSYIKKGLLPAQFIGKSYLIKRADLEASLSEYKSLKYKRS